MRESGRLNGSARSALRGGVGYVTEIAEFRQDELKRYRRERGRGDLLGRSAKERYPSTHHATHHPHHSRQDAGFHVLIQRRETESAFDNTIYGVTHRIASKENDLSLAPPTLIATVNPSAIPEPTTLSLLGVGCLALAIFRRRTPKAKA